VELGAIAEALGIPARHDGDGDDDEGWTHDEALGYVQRLHFDKLFAFAMGQQERLGASSAVRNLSPDVVRTMTVCYFGLPQDFFEKPRVHAGEVERYAGVLEAAYCVECMCEHA
jgi:hypothetical protein